MSGRPAGVLFYSGRQNFSCSTAAALAKITPRMDLDPNKKGLCSFTDLKELKGFRAAWVGEEGTGEGKNWNDTQSQEGSPRLREESPPGTPGNRMGVGEPVWNGWRWRIVAAMGGMRASAPGAALVCYCCRLTSTSVLLLPRPRLALLI